METQAVGVSGGMAASLTACASACKQVAYAERSAAFLVRKDGSLCAAYKPTVKRAPAVLCLF